MICSRPLDAWSFAGYGIPTPVSECLQGDVGLADRNVRFRQPVVDLPIHCESVCAGEGLDLHGSTPDVAFVSLNTKFLTKSAVPRSFPRVFIRRSAGGPTRRSGAAACFAEAASSSIPPKYAAPHAAGAGIPRSGGISQSWLAHDHHQLTVALPRALPAPHQHRDLFLATHQGREMALPRGR